MKHRYYLSFFLVAVMSVAGARPRRVPVFVSGTEGYAVFRIPAIVRAPNNDLLAFCEGRVHGASDFGNIKIVMKRSADGGETWAALEVVASYDTLQAGNPAPVPDMLDPRYPGGRLFLFYCTGTSQESDIRKGHGIREVWYKTSVDNGRTWSDPVNITLQVHRPRQPSVNSSYVFPEDWRSYATTPGHAVQLVTGRYAGRILVPINHSSGEPGPQFAEYAAGDFYTDDHGRSFHLGQDVGVPGGNEATAAETGPGRVMLNARNQRGDIRQRIVAISSDGGAAWDTAYFDRNLPDPVCQGSILTIGSGTDHAIVAFCNNDDTRRRNNLTLRISLDEGRSWARKVVVDRTTDTSRSADYTAYSDIIQLGDRVIGVLYERDSYGQIAFAPVRW